MTQIIPDRRCETCLHDLGGGYNNCKIDYRLKKYNELKESYDHECGQ